MTFGNPSECQHTLSDANVSIRAIQKFDLKTECVKLGETMSDQKKKIRTVIFGAGFMGRVHTEGIRRLGNVEIAGIAAETAEEARSFAESAGIGRSTGDYRELLADSTVDAVHVCTPNQLHYPMVKAALEAGKHVICEKPLTMTSAEARELVALAEKKNLAHCVNH